MEEYQLEIHIQHFDKEELRTINMFDSEEELNKLVEEIEDWFNSEDS